MIKDSEDGMTLSEIGIKYKIARNSASKILNNREEILSTPVGMDGQYRKRENCVKKIVSQGETLDQLESSGSTSHEITHETGQQNEQNAVQEQRQVRIFTFCNIKLNFLN